MLFKLLKILFSDLTDFLPLHDFHVFHKAAEIKGKKVDSIEDVVIVY